MQVVEDQLGIVDKIRLEASMHVIPLEICAVAKREALTPIVSPEGKQHPDFPVTGTSGVLFPALFGIKNAPVKNRCIPLYFFMAFTISRRMTAPIMATIRLQILKPVIPVPPNKFINAPPMNPPTIPTIMLAPTPIRLSLPVSMLAIQPASAPITIQPNIPMAKLLSPDSIRQFNGFM
jgi:hypothetical protein